HEPQRAAPAPRAGELPALQARVAGMQVGEPAEQVRPVRCGDRLGGRSPPRPGLHRRGARRRRGQEDGRRHQGAGRAGPHFWTITSVAVTLAAVVEHAVSVPLTCTLSPAARVALQSVDFFCPLHLKLAPEALTSTRPLERFPFTCILNPLALPEDTLPSSSMCW